MAEVKCTDCKGNGWVRTPTGDKICPSCWGRGKRNE